ncbi:hypothetical protein PR202_ga12840 [Eleusine coracana subsp. coracana]|uniref:Uncharacterized protein n=1 Tax=Eleusine coracana subsp. coracana TaxID=191504 RepID=A0AAV5CDA8_ELECO|nr:hypothetical protein PR202_ga12840 [Eleusine coracana subsp. coracana]
MSPLDFMIIATLVNEFIQQTESILVVIDLQVSVPSNTMLNIVTVRCGHCTSLLSVNLRGLIQSLPVQNHLQVDINSNSNSRYRLFQENFKVHNISFTENFSEYTPSPSKYRMPTMFSTKHDQDHMLHVRVSIRHLTSCRLIFVCCQQLQRKGNVFHQHIIDLLSEEEIRRIKASNPDISHREAFSTAAKNWAHFPNIHFGLGPNESSKKLDEAIGASSHSQKDIGASSRSQKVQGLY